MVKNRDKVLLFGANGFTGRHLSPYLKERGFLTIDSSIDIRDKEAVIEELEENSPNFIINLAGISSPAHKSELELYSVNTLGALNIVDAVSKLKLNPKKIILSSSGVVYGSNANELTSEDVTPLPINHYGSSKLAMEHLLQNYSKLNILVTRPFNYVGVGQSREFLIPKIVDHFRRKAKFIELGNLDIEREFNDIEFALEAYYRLLKIEKRVDKVNIASGRGVKLKEIIELMKELSGYDIEIRVNPKFIRKNDIKVLKGDPTKLFNLVGKIPQKSFKDTLQSIYRA